MNASTVDKTLVVLPNNLGDVIMATPLLEGLRKNHAPGFIAYLVEEGFEAGLINNPHVDTIITFPRRHIRNLLNSANCQEGIQDLTSTLYGIDGLQFDTIVNLSQHPYVSYLVSAIYARNRMGQHFLLEGNHAVDDDWSQYLYAVPFARSCNDLHATDVYRRIAGACEHCGRGTIVLSKDELQDAGRLLAECGVRSEATKLMLFQPGAAMASKRWGVDSFVALGRRLTNVGWTIGVMGAPFEKEEAGAIVNGIEQSAFLLAGHTSFRQAIGITAHAGGLVTGDTALMHAAAALQTPLYALFGSTSPVETGPYASGCWVFSARCKKRPCFRESCDAMSCMKSIAADDVFHCIHHQAPPSGARCDIFRTVLEPNGDYSLIPVAGAEQYYVNTADAVILRSAFEEHVQVAHLIDELDLQQTCRNGGQLLEKLHAMIDLLQQFTESKDRSHITNFEHMKGSLETLEGIGAFWKAVLNIRLNSITLCDPLRAITASLQVCRRTARQIEQAIAPHTASIESSITE
ncbi:MAG: hypothetical protein GF398_04730 [Chitinivibrionales bacterium]|nr:hypothetical protein [Chitinivibrionales bacterium]